MTLASYKQQRHQEQQASAHQNNGWRSCFYPHAFPSRWNVFWLLFYFLFSSSSFSSSCSSYFFFLFRLSSLKMSDPMPKMMARKDGQLLTDLARLDNRLNIPLGEKTIDVELSHHSHHQPSSESSSRSIFRKSR